MSGYVYRIFSKKGDCCYIGITTKPKISYRYNQHLYEFKRQRYYYSSYEVMQHEDHILELLEENIPKEQLLIKEKHYIQKFNNCVNYNKKKK